MNLRILIILTVALIWSSCSTKRNTVVSRAFHNLTARYNGYYYSTENIKEGEYKIEQNNKENYDKILPVFIYPSSEKAKATFPEFDKAIKKSTTCIQRHAIKDSKGTHIPTSGKWIDNNWINIGIARFYKRELFSGVEAFEYVARTYVKSKDKYLAMLWMIKSYNEIGAVSSSEPIISLLKNEKDLPTSIKRELPAVQADYFFRKGLYTEASAKLMEAVRNKNMISGVSKKKRARYSFIIAQLLEEQKDYKRAKKYYENTIKLKPNYEMVFYSKIKIARMLDVKRNSSEKTKKELIKMSKEFKNTDYFDVIFYTLGEIEEKEKNVDMAVVYYKKSVATSVANANQKALSYLKLGEISFENTNYQLAQAYYDSTLVTLPKDHPNYNKIVARQTTLINLVSYLNTIKREDSLQRVAKMSDAERSEYIGKIIRKLEEDEAKAKEEKEKLQNDNLTNPNNNLTNPVNTNQPATQTSFYFYNQNTVSFGVSDFFKKWGNRKNEDNWRRSNKTLTIDEPTKEITDTKTNDKETKVDPRKTEAFYLKSLPTSDSLLKASNKKIIEAFYLLGTTYKEDLGNNKKAIAAFEELNTRYAKHKYLLNTYYQMYRMYEQQKQNDKAEFYKEKILNQYPNSEFAQIIKNPKYAEEKENETSEVEKEYTAIYKKYTDGNCTEVITDCANANVKFGKSKLTPKFEFIRTVCAGKVYGVDSLEYGMKNIVALYPNSEVWNLANDILSAIKKQKNPEMFKSANTAVNLMGKDTFQINLEAEHFVLAITPDDPKIANGFKTKVGSFSKKYYSNKTFNITSTLFGTKMQLVIIKSFENAKEAAKFIENLEKDTDVFSAEVKKELVTLVNISAENLPMYYKKQNVSGYNLFYTDNYKAVIPKAASTENN